MKQKNTISVEYKNPVHLFRDELLAIEKIFKDDLACSGLEISFDDFDSDNVVSIPADQRLSHTISFHSNNPYFSLEVRQFSSRFYAAEESLSIRGAIQKIQNIFDGAIPKSVGIRKGVGKSIYGLGILSGIFFVVSPIDIKVLKDIVISPLIIFFLFFLCLISWGQMMWPMKPTIEFEMKKNRKNFWDRNRDQIYVGLIVGIPTAIVSFVLGILLG